MDVRHRWVPRVVRVATLLVTLGLLIWLWVWTYSQVALALADGKVGMMANHLCAWRREVGSAVSFPSNLGYNDDVFWYKPLLASGLVRSEEHVTRVLYVYRFHPARTVNEQRAVERATYQ